MPRLKYVRGHDDGAVFDLTLQHRCTALIVDGGNDTSMFRRALRIEVWCCPQAWCGPLDTLSRKNGRERESGRCGRPDLGGDRRDYW